MKGKLAILFLLLTIGFAAPVLLGFREVYDIHWPNYHTFYQPEQPIPFSHRLHAGYLNIDCQYCHTAADQGRHAGVPSVDTCMNCHETVAGQTESARKNIAKLYDAVDKGEGIAWKRVHNNPDFAYFNHQTHVRIAKQGEGFDCQECHGDMEHQGVAVQEHNLSMGWCIECHRQWNVEYETQGYEPAAPLSCDACHR
jgi:hypothetical protein